MVARLPRVVVATRTSQFEQVVAEHGTRGQAEFVLRGRGSGLEELEAQHRRFIRARDAVTTAVPRAWRRADVNRADLDRFLFQPDDVVVAIGQDGLVANVAKYLNGQPVVGVNPDPDRYEGVLVATRPEDAAELVLRAAREQGVVDERVMVEAVADDGSRLLALNEVFIGRHSHQSARYRFETGVAAERQISSGVIVSTGTGATGWARSIHRERASAVELPTPAEGRLAYFVRECIPSPMKEAAHTEGVLAKGERLTIWSEMESGGTVFGDGIESDALAFGWGRRVTVAMAPERLRLVVG